MQVEKYEASALDLLRVPVDGFRIKLEGWMGCTIDWWPFPPVEYLRAPGQVKISWKVNYDSNAIPCHHQYSNITTL